MTVFALAESLAGIGRWRFDFTNGQCEFSPELKRMFGFPGDGEVSFEQLWSAVPDGGADYRARFKERGDSRTPWRHEFTVRRGTSGDCRILQSIAVNEFGADGALRENIGVLIDVTEQRQREEALSQERARAMRLAAEANVLALTDPLTGLANRRRTLAQLDKCVARARELDCQLSLVTFDIDHFKQVNDTFGHQMGDEVLARVAEIARSQMRESDVLG
ncbi:MAG: GGDEF domain-containing protein, partial [Novosphingobium sp.]|nr:GGDEF domain-containing protein [Novosphingobium sp.]